MKKTLIALAMVSSVAATPALAGKVKWCQVNNYSGTVGQCFSNMKICQASIRGHERVYSCVAR